MYRAVTSEEVAAYRQLVEKLARRYVGSAGAEFDDLVQEGLISVWEALRRNNNPSAEVVQYAMRMWVRFLRRLQRGDTIATDYLRLDSATEDGPGSVLGNPSA